MFTNNEETKTTVGAQFYCANASRSIAALLLGVWLFAPQAALAQNECDPVAPTGTDPSSNGSDPDSYICPGGGYPSGISYSSAGELTIEIASSTVNIDANASMSVVGNDTDNVNLLFNGNLTGSSEPVWLLDIDTNATTTIENDAFIGTNGSSTSFGDRPAKDAVIRAAGAGNLVIQNNDTINGRVDFSALSGGVVFNNTGTEVAGDGFFARNDGWNTAGDSVFSPADDVINNFADAWLQTSSGGYRNPFVGSPTPPPPVTTIDFGDGNDIINNAGVLAVGTSNQDCHSSSRCPPRESLTTFENLEEFNNSGVILLGRGGGATNSESTDGTDLLPDDILAMPGTHFEGSGGSRIELDAVLGGGGQSACAGEITSDCIDLSGGSTGGITVITVRDVFADDRGDAVDIVLVDVSGGTSAPGHFVLDPVSTKYNPAHGGVIDKGLFLYPLVYDDANQQHKLAAAPSDDAMQMPLIVEAAEATWRTATASWFDRQVDLRDTRRRESGTGGGAWVRVTTDRGERDAHQAASVFDRDLSYDNSHDVDSSAINLGWDLVSASEGDRAWLLGATIGYVHTSMDFDRSDNRPTLDGMVAGVYGSYLIDNFFVDAVLNSTWTDLHMRIPDIVTGVGPDNDTASTDVRSIGGQLETGWRWQSGSIGIEPLASLSYIKTDFDDATISSSDRSRPDNTVDFGDNTSFRGGLGLRLTLDNTLGALKAQWNLTGRVLEEFDEESEVAIKSLGPDMAVTSELDGTITEVSGGVSVYNESGSLSGFLNANLQSSDDYDSQGLSAGFRYQW